MIVKTVFLLEVAGLTIPLAPSYNGSSHLLDIIRQQRECISHHIGILVLHFNTFIDIPQMYLNTLYYRNDGVKLLLCLVL